MVDWGFGEALVFTVAAFIGSCNTTRDLTQGFLWQANESLTSADSLASTHSDLPELVTTVLGENKAQDCLGKQLGDGHLAFNTTLASQNVRFSFMSIRLYKCLSKQNLVLQIEQDEPCCCPS